MRRLYGRACPYKGEFIYAHGSEDASEIITPVDAMFAHYPALCVTEKWDKFAYNGNALPKDAVGDVPDGHSISDVHRVRIYNSKEEFIGLYDYKKSENKYKLVKMFYTPDV